MDEWDICRAPAGALQISSGGFVCGVWGCQGQGVGGGEVSIRPGIGCQCVVDYIGSTHQGITLVGQFYLLSFYMAQGTAALLHGDRVARGVANGEKLPLFSFLFLLQILF